MKITISIINLTKNISAVLVLLIYSQLLYSIEISHGEMAGAIRTAGYPCARVLDLQSTSENSWKVKCNAGNYNVTRDADGNFNVITFEKDSSDNST